MVREVKPEDAWKAYENNEAIILDVRELDEVSSIGVPGAVHVPLGELSQSLGTLNQEQEIYCLCHVGQRSYMACEFLKARGYTNVTNISGGIIAWMKSGLMTSRSGGD